tara:strand:- start:66 stop:506 length:441 start_codon:yes stop_codon:yes gene_type:complete
MDSMNELYQQLILDHNRNPRNYRIIKGASHSAKGHNPLCGDEISIDCIIKNNIIEDIAFFGSGCAISKASASIMTTLLIGLNIEDAKNIFNKFHLLATRGEVSDGIEKLNVLAGVYKFPSRVKCATLSWHTFNNAINKLKKIASTE